MARDLRLSVIDRCNLRCAYCLPADAGDWIPRPQLLSVEEYRRLARLAFELGVNEVRVTGGEPLLRPDLADIVAAVRDEFIAAGLPVKLALTTNGVGLAPRVDELIDAGLTRINVSIDTLDAHRFASLTRRPARHFDSIMEGLAAVTGVGLDPVKLNTVVVDEHSLNEIPAIVSFALSHGYQWRAIEFMPIGPLAASFGSRPTAHDIIAVLRENFSLTPAETEASAPAKLWSVAASTHHPAGQVGVIASMSAPFCADCDRTRLSANGRIYACLFSDLYTDLLPLLRGGGSDEELKQLWAQAMWAKSPGHQFLPKLPGDYSMSKIGG